MEAIDSRDAKILRFEALRVQLAEVAPRDEPVNILKTGLSAIDENFGGLIRGAINEFSGPSASGSLFLETLLERTKIEGTHLALVDAADAFEPNQWSADLLQRMLWVRCHSIKEAIRSTDLLLRDGNLPMVVLDTLTCTQAALRRVPGSTWHRFARTMETSGTALIVLSVRPTAEGVRLRITDAQDWQFAALQEPRAGLRSALKLSVRERGTNQRRHVA